jgi:hypothetical protein
MQPEPEHYRAWADEAVGALQGALRWADIPQLSEWDAPCGLATVLATVTAAVERAAGRSGGVDSLRLVLGGL